VAFHSQQLQTLIGRAQFGPISQATQVW